jgi:hypothetical protein
MRGGGIGTGVKVVIGHGARGRYWRSLLRGRRFMFVFMLLT